MDKMRTKNASKVLVLVKSSKSGRKSLNSNKTISLEGKAHGAVFFNQLRLQLSKTHADNVAAVAEGPVVKSTCH